MKKYFKILLSLTLIVALTLPASGVMGVSNAVSTACDLNSGEIQLLTYLGIIEDTSLDYSAGISRGELAKLAAATSKANELIAPSGKEIFLDVPAGHQYFNEISTLVELGILSGNGSGYFFPDRNATYNDACKIFSMMLGGIITDSSSFIKEAKRIGVIDEFVLGTETLTWGKALELAYNTLHSNIIKTDIFGDYIHYTTVDNCLAIEYYHGLVLDTGILEGVTGTTLTQVDPLLEEGEVLINDQIFRYEKGKEMLGKSVIYYYNKADKKKTVIDIQYLYANPEYNSTIEIASEDVISFSGSTLNYYNGNTKKEITVTGRTDVLYNGIAYTDWQYEDFKPEEGKITLLNNDRDEEYEVAFIESYYYAIVGSVDSTKNLIYCTYPEGKIIGGADGSFKIQLYDAGRKTFIGGLEAGTPIIVKESKNTTGYKNILIETFKEIVTGKVTGFKADSIIIDGKEIKKSNLYSEDAPVKLGDTITAYIYNGKCAVVSHDATPGFVAAYLLGAWKEGNSFEEHLLIYVREANKKMVEYTCVEKVKIDGVVRSVDVALEKLRESAAKTSGTSGSQWPYSQLIRYKANEKGEITHIDTLSTTDGKEDEGSLKAYYSIASNGAADENPYKRRRYFSNTKSFHDEITNNVEFILPQSANQVFWIPTTDRDNVDFFNNSTGFANDTEYTIEAYNVDEFTRQAEYVLYYFTPSKSASTTSTPYIVESVATSINSKEEVVYEIGLLGTSSATYFCDDEMVAAGPLEVGNIVQIGHNYSGEVVGVRELYNAEENIVKISATNDADYPYYDSMRMFYGVVVSADNTNIFIATDVSVNTRGENVYENLTVFKVPSSLSIYMYDREKNCVEVGSMANIVPCSVNTGEATRVLFVTGGGSLRYIYIVD